MKRVSIITLEKAKHREIGYAARNRCKGHIRNSALVGASWKQKSLTVNEFPAPLYAGATTGTGEETRDPTENPMIWDDGLRLSREYLHLIWKL